MKKFSTNVKILIFFIIGFAAAPAFSLASVLYIETDFSEYRVNDTFVAAVKLNTAGEYINAVQAVLNFPSDILEVRDFSAGNSVLSIWIEKPIFSNEAGVVSFSGGIPGGYQGWDGVLGKIIFKAKKEGSAVLEFNENSQALLNDGFGTKSDLKTEKSVFNILPASQDAVLDQWQEELKKDAISPEPFEIEIQQDPVVFEGKNYIIFSTTDKQTGIDRYEIKEENRDWKLGESPYVLKNQKLNVIIQVKAVDKAGNERIAEYLPQEKPLPYRFIIFASIFILTALIYLMIRKFIRKK